MTDDDTRPTLELCEELMAHALKCIDRTYSPYSKLAVGAAVLTDTGEVIGGTNIENRTLPLTICAERVAIHRAVFKGARQLHAVAVAARIHGALTECYPCGACLEVMAEFAPQNGHLWIIVRRDENLPLYKLDELLPHARND